MQEGGGGGIRCSQLIYLKLSQRLDGVAQSCLQTLNNNYSTNRSTGAVVLVSGREVASRVVQSIVQTMAKTMDALLFRQQLQVKKCPLCLARKNRVLHQGRKLGGAMGVSAPPHGPQRSEREG